MKTVTVHNKKGGVGKSTTTQSLASALLHKGYRVLVIDCDSQRNTSDAYDALNDRKALTMFDFFSGRCEIAEAIQHTASGDIIISDKHLNAAETWINERSDGLLCLKNALNSIRDMYDFVLIDTNMSHNAITKAAILACDEVIVPVDDSKYAMQGTFAAANLVVELNEKYGTSVKIGGILRIKYRADYQSWKAVDNAYEALVTDEVFNTKVYNTTIPTGTIVSKAQLAKQSVIDYEKGSSVSKAYIQFAEEFVA